MAEPSNIIGNRTLFGIRVGPKFRHVRLFIMTNYDNPDLPMEIVDVSIVVARIINKKLTKDGAIPVKPQQCNPIEHVAWQYAASIGTDKEHPWKEIK